MSDDRYVDETWPQEDECEHGDVYDRCTEPHGDNNLITSNEGESK